MQSDRFSNNSGFISLWIYVQKNKHNGTNQLFPKLGVAI